ncbi:hypothetical protein ES703_117616 [subsurface metagenome]
MEGISYYVIVVSYYDACIKLVIANGNSSDVAGKRIAGDGSLRAKPVEGGHIDSGRYGIHRDKTLTISYGTALLDGYICTSSGFKRIIDPITNTFAGVGTTKDIGGRFCALYHYTDAAYLFEGAPCHN